MKKENKSIGQLSLSKNDRQALEEFVGRLKKEFMEEIREIKLFGSKIRKGSSNTESDIDVLIVVKDQKKLLADDITDIAFDVNLKYDVYISPRILAETVFKDPLWRATAFIKNLEKDAIVI